MLRASGTGWGPQRAALTYWQLTELEATFRGLKSKGGQELAA